MAICPYFDHEKTYCDVGEDYISPYDVVAMSHYCSGRYQECERYEGLSFRHPQVTGNLVTTETTTLTKSTMEPQHKPPAVAMKSAASGLWLIV